MQSRSHFYRYYRLLVAFPFPFFICESTLAAEFNNSFLFGKAISTNWNEGSKIAPGVYAFDLYINDSWIGNFDFRIDHNAIIYMRQQDISLLPLSNTDHRGSDKAEWVNVSILTHGSKVKFDAELLKIDLSIPQAFIVKQDAQWIAPEKWDKGINGLYTGYNISYNHDWQKNSYQQTDNTYMTLQSGINLKSLHFVDNTIYSKSTYQKEGRWITNERYLEKAFSAIKSFVRVGRSFTNSDVFDNIRFDGVSVTQEQKMYPDSYITYMPVIRGIAKSNATVRVYQNGNVVYQLNVPPGPFEISEMMPTGSRSDLNVIVEESDGSSQSFTVLYSTDAQMLRTGTAQWKFNSGRVNIQNVNFHPDFIQGSFSYGFNNYLTLLSGTTLSNKYKSLLLGGAVAIPVLGSFSITSDSAYFYSHSGNKYNDALNGRKYILAWSKYFISGTNITVKNSFSDSKNYTSFYDYVMNNLQHTGYSSMFEKTTFSANIDQVLLPGWGRLSLQGTQKRFWNSEKKLTDYSLSYNNFYGNISYTFYASKTFYDNEHSVYETTGRKKENQIGLSVSIPLNIFDRRVSISNSSLFNDGSYTSSNTSISSGSDATDYNLSLINKRNGDKVSGSAYAAWRTPYSRITANYAESRSYRQAGGSASGTLLFWRKGVLASSGTGNTFVVLEAPGAVGATVNGNRSYKTNAAGQVLIPSASAYRMNSYQISENDRDSSNTVVMDNIRYTAPWFRSIAYIKYKTDQRKTFTYSAKTQENQPLPFGATVLDQNRQEVGYVAQGSQLYVKAKHPPSVIYVTMNSHIGSKDQTCTIIKPAEGDSFENVCRFD